MASQYAWDVSIALAVMRAESGCNPDAYNPSNHDGSDDAGLMQINSIHVTSGLIEGQTRFDPAANIRADYAIYQGSGWGAWDAINNGAYLQFQ